MLTATLAHGTNKNELRHRAKMQAEKSEHRKKWTGCKIKKSQKPSYSLGQPSSKVTTPQSIRWIVSSHQEIPHYIQVFQKTEKIYKSRPLIVIWRISLIVQNSVSKSLSSQKKNQHSYRICGTCIMHECCPQHLCIGTRWNPLLFQSSG